MSPARLYSAPVASFQGPMGGRRQVRQTHFFEGRRKRLAEGGRKPDDPG